jgi:hypothetical protein
MPLTSSPANTHARRLGGDRDGDSLADEPGLAVLHGSAAFGPPVTHVRLADEGLIGRSSPEVAHLCS